MAGLRRRRFTLSPGILFEIGEKHRVLAGERLIAVGSAIESFPVLHQFPLPRRTASCPALDQ